MLLDESPPLSCVLECDLLDMQCLGLKMAEHTMFICGTILRGTSRVIFIEVTFVYRFLCWLYKIL